PRAGHRRRSTPAHRTRPGPADATGPYGRNQVHPTRRGTPGRTRSLPSPGRGSAVAALSPTGRVDPAVAGAPGVARTPAAVAITRAAAVAITVATVAGATGGDRGPAVRTGVVTRRILHQPLRLQARQRAHIHVHHCPRYVCTPV